MENAGQNPNVLFKILPLTRGDPEQIPWQQKDASSMGVGGGGSHVLREPHMLTNTTNSKHKAELKSCPYSPHKHTRTLTCTHNQPATHMSEFLLHNYSGKPSLNQSFE